MGVVASGPLIAPKDLDSCRTAFSGNRNTCEDFLCKIPVNRGNFYVVTTCNRATSLHRQSVETARRGHQKNRRNKRAARGRDAARRSDHTTPRARRAPTNQPRAASRRSVKRREKTNGRTSRGRRRQVERAELKLTRRNQEKNLAETGTSKQAQAWGWRRDSTNTCSPLN